MPASMGRNTTVKSKQEQNKQRDAASKDQGRYEAQLKQAIAESQQVAQNSGTVHVAEKTDSVNAASAPVVSQRVVPESVVSNSAPVQEQEKTPKSSSWLGFGAAAAVAALAAMGLGSLLSSNEDAPPSEESANKNPGRKP